MTGPVDILVVDDQQAILDDFSRVLAPVDESHAETLDSLAAVLGASTAGPRRAPLPAVHLHSALQGEGAVTQHATLVSRGTPIAVAFVDIQMPPGIDGIETVRRLWQAQPDLEVVLCTAYSDYSWHTILDRLEHRDQLVILRKPFDPIEVRQLAVCLSEKWRRGRALATRMQELEQQVRAEVTRRLSAELSTAQKFESLGRLAAGIAHEINTPAQYIQTSVDYIGTTIDEVEALLAGQPGVASTALDMLREIPDAVADASEGVARVTRIVRSVREYAHTRTTSAPELVDINAQLRMVADLARAQYKHDAELVMRLGDVPRIPGDGDELGRALLNLVVNAGQAIQAARRGRGTITITSRRGPGTVCIEIADTGVGIPREHWSRLFEPFFTTKPRGEGTGQGLALARAAVVDLHRGNLTFDSVPGVGSTFYVTLPVETEQEVAA